MKAGRKAVGRQPASYILKVSGALWSKQDDARDESSTDVDEYLGRWTDHIVEVGRGRNY